jgi:hypothetical protein
MQSFTIEALLRKRGAWLKGKGGDHGAALGRAAATRKIAEHYAVFEHVRDALLGESEERYSRLDGHQGVAEILESLLSSGVIDRTGPRPAAPHAHGKRFLSGGWLEELAYLAAVSAGADEVLYGQCVGWSVQGYEGENEIDLIVRRGGVLGFVSCKALKSMIDIEDRKHRNRLMDAIHEADNLADHFGRPGERVAVLVTTDLFDEMRGSPRYKALMGKAAVLDVRIIALEELGWDRLVHAIGELMNTKASDGELHEGNPV